MTLRATLNVTAPAHAPRLERELGGEAPLEALQCPLRICAPLAPVTACEGLHALVGRQEVGDAVGEQRQLLLATRRVELRGAHAALP